MSVAGATSTPTLAAVSSDVIATGQVDNNSDEPKSTPTITGMSAAYSPY